MNMVFIIIFPRCLVQTPPPKKKNGMSRWVLHVANIINRYIYSSADDYISGYIFQR